MNFFLERFCLWFSLNNALNAAQAANSELSRCQLPSALSLLFVSEALHCIPNTVACKRRNLHLLPARSVTRRTLVQLHDPLTLTRACTAIPPTSKLMLMFPKNANLNLSFGTSLKWDPEQVLCLLCLLHLCCQHASSHRVRQAHFSLQNLTSQRC